MLHHLVAKHQLLHRKFYGTEKEHIREFVRFMKFIIGKKIEMSQIFKGNTVIPVTLIEAGPCFVTQIKTKEPHKASVGKEAKKDDYEAVQIGFEKKEKHIKKTEKGKEYKYLKEFLVSSHELSAKIGDKISVSIFEEGDKVKISGISKGKGFQGAVKRWGFSGRNASHGVKHEHRTLGSVGIAGLGRVLKGKKMPGRMGGGRITVKNLKVARVNEEQNILAVKGAVPGHRGTLLLITTRRYK